MNPIEFLGQNDAIFAAVGNKSKNLHSLKLAEFPVPDGFVIQRVFRDDATSLEQILNAVKQIGGYPVAVRSSALQEDLSGASFAGLYESYLNVKSDDELSEKVKLVIESATSERVRAYSTSKSIRGFSKMSILVQKMIDAKAAGVFFSLHPNHGKEEESYAELCQGLGERLVSGHVSPTRYTLSSRNGSVLSKEISKEGDLLSLENAKVLCDFGLKISAQFKTPQDIEFAIDSKDKIWILQSRPITSVQWRNDVDQFTNADFKDGGVSASVCAPMMYSLYEEAMQRSMQAYFKTIKLLKKNAEQKTWIQSFYGRAYWNAGEVKRLLFKIPGFSEREFDLDLGIQKNYGIKGPHVVPLTPFTLIPVIPAALAVEKEYSDQLIFTDHYFERVFLPAQKALENEKKSLPLEEWVPKLLDFQTQTECDYFRTIYNNTNLQSDFKKRIAKVSKKINHPIDFTLLYSGVEGISHLKSQIELASLIKTAASSGMHSIEFKAQFKHHLAEHGFHADRELDILCPRFDEVPELILKRIQNFVDQFTELKASLLEPEKQISAQNEKFETVMAQLEAAWNKAVKIRTKARFRAIRKDLGRVRLYLRRREEMRECSSRAYAMVRHALLALNQRWKKDKLLNHDDDIFFMTRSEVMGKKLPSESLRADLSNRKLFLAGFENFVPPNELGFGVEVSSAMDWSDAEGGKTLKGLGCSHGIIEGDVRVITELEQAYLLKKGEILVTRFTDPGWTTILSLASGVITEVGGLLSHAAVIGRELGVPAILNLPSATTLLKNGDRIRMNGSTGGILLLSPQPKSTKL